MKQDILRWYSVKLIYLHEVSGEPAPELIDQRFIDDYIAYEESIILTKANSFDSAYIQAEQHAKGVERNYKNIYGQEINVSLYDSLDCFLINEEAGINLQEGLEVYSNITEGKKSKDKASYLNEIFPVSNEIKYMLLNIELTHLDKNGN